MQKLASFCVFVFVLPKHIAHKMVITSNFVSQKAFFIIFRKLKPKTNKKNEKTWKMGTFWAQKLHRSKHLKDYWSPLSASNET